MTSSWEPLRTFVERYVDEQISLEPDPEARATMARHREHIADEVERIMLERCLAESDAHAEQGTLH